MQLESISVQGFRSIADLADLRIGSPTLLTGHNDAGKSALLDAIRFLLNTYELTERDRTYSSQAAAAANTGDPDESSLSRVEETVATGTFSLGSSEALELNLPPEVRVRRRAHLDASPVYEYEYEVPDDERLRDVETLTVPNLKRRLKELGLSADGPNKPDLLATLRKAAAEGPSTPGWGPVTSEILKALPTVQSFNPRGISDAEDAIRSALQTAYRAHADDPQLRGSIRELELDLEKKIQGDAEELRAHIVKTIDDIGDVKILPSVSFSSGLKNTQVSVTNSAGEAVHLGEAGAGRARRVALAVWEFNTGLLNDSGDVVIIYDEPDTHLDYTHQRNFMRLIQRQTGLPNVRMAIATHSMNLIDGVDIADVALLQHDVHHRTCITRLVDDSEVGAHLGAVAASLGLRNTVLLHERLFVGVEGATEAAALPVLFKLAVGRQLEACGIAMWPCNNNEGALKFASFLANHGRDVVFLVDHDSTESAKHVFGVKRLLEHGLDETRHAIYLGNPNELEDLFEDSVWASVANESWPHRDDRPWTADDFEPLREGRKFSSDLLELLRTESFSGPRSKPELVTTLALHLRDPADIPKALTDAFQVLVDKAS